MLCYELSAVSRSAGGLATSEQSPPNVPMHPSGSRVLRDSNRQRLSKGALHKSVTPLMLPPLVLQLLELQQLDGTRAHTFISSHHVCMLIGHESVQELVVERS